MLAQCAVIPAAEGASWSHWVTVSGCSPGAVAVGPVPGGFGERCRGGAVGSSGRVARKGAGRLPPCSVILRRML